MDDQEARAVANAYLSDHTLTQLYDAAIIPVLGMAEQDRHKGALSPTREEFVFLSIREMLAECSERAHRRTRDARRLGAPWPGAVSFRER